MAAPVRVVFVAVCWWVTTGLPTVAAGSADDERILRAAGLSTDGGALLDFFRKQTASEATQQRARALIEQLGSESFRVRERASGDLVALGPVVLPLLRAAMRETTDLEIRRRARACAEQIQTDYSPAIAAAAARLLAVRRPVGTAEVLLAFLPGPYEDMVLEEIQTTLVAVARTSGKLDPAFAIALTAAVPARRATAAVTLCRVGAAEHRPALRKLLQDKEPSVRWQVAQELAVAGERESVPVLIELLTRVPLDQAEQIEELLCRLAGAAAPSVPLGHDAADRGHCRDAWRRWWSEHGARVDLAVLRDAERPLGYTLLVLLNAKRVVEWGRDGKPRWQIDGLASPLDAEVLPGRRVLIAEHDTCRVTERTFQGEVLWEKKLTEAPFHAQRLPGGATFIATRKRLLEVDPSGKNEIVHYRSDGSIITARRFRDGRIGCIENGSYFELDAGGKERRRFAVPAGVVTTNSLTLLSNGNLIVVVYGGGTVQEYDAAGKVVWQASLGRPLCALRLPGGNTLVSSQDMVLVEFDRTGKEVSRREAQGHPCQIRRR
jgi:HEAT repeat protein